MTSIDNCSIIITVLNTFETSLSTSFIDFVTSIVDENIFFQTTTIILQNFLERARREARRQVRNVYSYDLVFNQIVSSFYIDALSAKISSHLLFYLLTTVSIQISTSTIREVKQKRDIDKPRDRSRESDVEKEISRT